MLRGSTQAVAVIVGKTLLKVCNGVLNRSENMLGNVLLRQERTVAQ